MHIRSAVRRFRPGRAAAAVATVCAALLAAALPTAGAAHAAVPDRWGFAFLDNPTPPPSYAPDPSRQWGSWTSPSANPVTVDQTGLGTYTVHFPLIGGSGGIAHTTAVGPNGDSCQLTGWGASGSTEDVGVACFTNAGTPDNSRFTVVFTSSSGTLPAGPSGHGYVFSDISGAILGQYNSSGAGNSVGKTGTGVWKVFLPNLGQAAPVGNLQVTAVDNLQGARCKVGSWSPSASGQGVIVDCYNAAGAPYDTRWTLSYSVQRAVHGPAFPPKSFGYLWSNPSVPPSTDFNSQGATNTAVPVGSGYAVAMPVIANPPDDAQVTAFGPDPLYCTLTAPWARSGGTASFTVLCFAPGGAQATRGFFAAYTGAF